MTTKELTLMERVLLAELEGRFGDESRILARCQHCMEAVWIAGRRRRTVPVDGPVIKK